MQAFWMDSDDSEPDTAGQAFQHLAAAARQG